MDGPRPQSGKNSFLNTQVSPVLSCALIALVVVVVVGPLMVTPRRGLEAARKSQCQLNLKNCAFALQAYCADYDGTLPSSALVTRSKTWNKADFIRFATRAGFVKPVPRQPKTWRQVLSRYVNEPDAAFCPSDAVDHNDIDSTASYWWRAAVDQAWYGLNSTRSCRKLTDFAYAPDQVLLYERAGLHSGSPKGLRNDVQVNVAFFDGRVKSISLTNSLPGAKGKWVTSPLGPGEPAYFNYDNKRPGGSDNPPPPDTTTSYVDPARYSDVLP